MRKPRSGVYIPAKFFPGYTRWVSSFQSRMALENLLSGEFVSSESVSSGLPMCFSMRKSFPGNPFAGLYIF
ncbi:hypothetical protein A2685_00865 [Candidatus Woesebacteria bacterium RIFCSPHIGHO2_01_FULL_37_10]|uniref:Uncharacterized protein n=1 Tax=Candidatus Woesebacteria bacterium RIFCSPHIGHO2_01_FULL_37_10 TaxID=1802489 RepID=A0A1F7XUD3_9BACT|nr:MAG: hypothetical protein A2685_00865 [Candidatus Woesebacteria bacterium RIFCSPHIGHO2_01_FULL_37_10]